MKEQNLIHVLLLEHLSKKSSPQSVPDLLKILDISEETLLRSIQHLQDQGIKIVHISSKGYTLSEPLLLLNTPYLQENLPHKGILLHVFEEINSTSIYLNSKDSPSVHICLAESQTAGRGRLEKKWYSPFGQNIYLSLKYPFPKNSPPLSGLSLMVGLSLVKALSHFFNFSIPFQLKWPNDVMLDHKKLGGVLIEMQKDPCGIETAVIGIGLNVNMLPQEDSLISSEWTSLRAFHPSYINRNDLLVPLLKTLFEDLEIFKKNGFFPFLKRWKAMDALYNKSISLTFGGQQLYGISKGITIEGHLLLEHGDGRLHAYSSGEAFFIRPTQKISLN